MPPVDVIHELAVIGGGLAGLALAHSLQARRVDWALFEARPRLGGRILTTHTPEGLAVDLGPAWYWPERHPSIARLVADLGLDSIAQPDDGRVLLLDDPNRQPRALAFDGATGTLAASEDTPATPGAVHGGARRLSGGMQGLVQALSQALPAQRLNLGQTLQRVADHGSHVSLLFSGAEGSYTVQARRVVLCLPPRVAAERIAFEPALPADVLQAMQSTPTWMATAAKAAVPCARPAWREAGLTGNAWVTHPQAVLAEVYDAGPAPTAGAAAGAAALAGFVALGVAQRAQFRAGMPLLIDSQVTMLFGAEAAPGTPQLHDWATEPLSCSTLDLEQEALAGEHPPYGDTALQGALWQGRLWLGGSETARQGGGYLEGALASAGRLRRQLSEAASGDTPPAAAADPDPEPEPAALNPATPPAAEAALAQALQHYTAWVQQRREEAFSRYRQQLHQSLSQQQAEQLTQRALLGALESLYDEALAELAALPTPTHHLPVQAGRHTLTPQVLQPFMGLADELLAEALRFNATSCALSNFPFEHRPDGEYVRVIRRDLAAAWQSFALGANQQLQQRPA
ncbi:flavin monoamine oxidase family protein [Aquabacterium sp. OR-4]|uniref:flavin monoamine oxidase family protein n=1 Tax=Aquabacterium sp. OR-4 TaxID=2978127 RepID=UPI0028C936AF|nr:FAD-dependent oxidoreductase [Aquabacterium sp. OR-4]MDT7838746.1 FAD-dependent oxidoreductase [Aquabacterium sp. OR-4]